MAVVLCPAQLEGPATGVGYAIDTFPKFQLAPAKATDGLVWFHSASIRRNVLRRSN